MNILVLTPYVAWPLDHGGRIRTYHMLRALAAAHAVVNVAAARRPVEREDAAALAAIGVTVRPGLLPERDVTTPAARIGKWISVACGRSSLPRRWRDAGFAELVRREAAARTFDLAIIDTPWMDVYQSEIGAIPYIAATQNVEGDILLDVARRKRGADGRVAARDAALFLRREAAWVAGAACALAVSEDDAARLRTLAPAARVSVVENGVDLERLAPIPARDPAGPLLFVGSFDYPANAEAAAFLVRDVLPAVRARLGGARVTLAGRRASAAVATLAGEGVAVASDVPDLGPLYAVASAVVVPLLAGGGSRLKILEALALGRPVVTTTVGARGLAVRDGVEVLLADEPAAFASALARLRDDRDLAPRLAAAGRAFVEAHHDWRALERRFLVAIEAAQGAHP